MGSSDLTHYVAADTRPDVLGECVGRVFAYVTGRPGTGKTFTVKRQSAQSKGGVHFKIRKAS